MAPLLDDMNWFYEPEQEKRWCLLPRKCCKSGESLWFKKAWRVRWYDWGSHEDRWYCEREYLWKQLKDA